MRILIVLAVLSIFGLTPDLQAKCGGGNGLFARIMNRGSACSTTTTRSVTVIRGVSACSSSGVSACSGQMGVRVSVAACH